MASTSGPVAIVTGGGGAIGSAIAARLHRDGYRVGVLDRDRAAAEKVAAELGDTALALSADVTDPDVIGAVFQGCQTQFGRLDALVACAGISRPAPLESMTDEDWDTVLDVNLTGAFVCAQAAAALIQGAGSIVLIGSLAGLGTAPLRFNYISSKAGLVGLTRALAWDLGPRQVRVNLIAPGQVMTEMGTRLQSPEEVEVKLRETPLRRHATPEDVAGVAAFLCSADAAYITGQCLYVDGGRTINKQPL